MNEEAIIYEWVVPADYPKTPFEDVAKAYRVVANADAMSGIVIYARYQDEWQANPWNLRPLVKQLLMVDDYSQAIGQFVVLNPISPEMAQALLVKVGRLMQHPGGSFERILKAMEGAIL